MNNEKNMTLEEIAKKMLEQHIDIEIISKVTLIPIEKLKKL